MAHQECGWPLGLQSLNVRIGLIRSSDLSGSLSFNALTSSSPSCSPLTSKSYFGTESSRPFFRKRSVTLGRLMGITGILELSSSSLGSGKQTTIREKKSNKTKACFSLCLRAHLDGTDTVGNALSLGHFLDVERRACINAQKSGKLRYFL